MKHGKRIARLQKSIPALANLSSAELLALDAELGETPAKSVVKLTGDEEKAACDEALAEKRKTAGEDAELSEEERESALEKARDKKGKDSKGKDKAKDEKAEDEEEPEEKAKDESEEEAEDEEEEEEPKPKGKDKAKDADPDHRKDFNSIKQGKDKGAKDKAHDSAMTMDEVNLIVEKAVKRASAATEARVTSRLNARSAALSKVAPIVGKLDEHAFDTAEGVYVYALEKIGIETDGLNAVGMERLIDRELSHKQTKRAPAGKHAMDTGSGGFDADALFQRTN